MFKCGNVTVEIKFPDSLKNDPVLLGLNATPEKASKHFELTISEQPGGLFRLQRDDHAPEEELSRGALAKRVLYLLAEIFQEQNSHIVSCSAVAWRDRAALFFGHGKSMVAAWLIDNGFAYVADELVSLGDVLEGFSGPLKLAEEGAACLSELADFGSAPMAKIGSAFFVSAKSEWRAASDLKPGVLVFLDHRPRVELRIEKLRADDAVARLKRFQKHGDDKDADLANLAMVTPAIKLSYSTFEQLDGVFDNLLQLVLGKALSPVAFDKFASAMPHRFAIAPADIPTRSDRVVHCKLSIGMATYDDYDGVYFSIQAIRLFHPEILDQVEFIIVDNNPSGPCGPDLKKLEQAVPNLRYIPEEKTIGTTIKNRVFNEASGKFVMCMDSHVMFPPGTLKMLLNYFDRNPETKDLLQGPLLYDDLKSTSSNWLLEKWSQGMLGKWHSDVRGAAPENPPFEIEAQGMGVFACRKDGWPGFNPLFRGFGGEEVYIHGKFRQLGHKALCLPFLRWVHRFGRPMGVPYPNSWGDRIRNGLIGYDELGWDTSALVAHFQELLGADGANRIIAEVCNEFGWSADSKLKPASQPVATPVQAEVNRATQG